MLDSFSIQAVQIIELAKEISQKRDDNITGSEHLLLAMYETPDSICRFLLQEKNITQEDLNNAFSKILIIHKVEHDHIVFTDKFQEIVLKAKETAHNVESQYVFDEHLFYSMLQDGDNAGCEILKILNLDLEEMIEDIEEIFNFYDGDFYSDIKKPHDNNNLPFLINLTEIKRAHPYVKRHNYLERIQYILSKKQKNNPLLIGSAGVGKTAIIEGLSQILENDTIYQLDLGSVVAGTKYRGELEEKLIKVMNFIKSSKAILFIDEIHNIVGAGSNDGSLDIANILKPYLSRSDIRLIGATTLEEYYKFIEKDKALMRRFQTVFIDEPSREETEAILMGIKDKYEEYHHMNLSLNNIKTIIAKCHLYIPQRTFPDKAIDVMDEVGARFSPNTPLDDIIDEVIHDITNINVAKVADIRSMQLTYPELKPAYLRFVERIKNSPNLMVMAVENEFNVEPLIRDLVKVFNFKEEMYLEINLDNYQDSNMINSLIGSTKGYVGYEQGGILSEHIIKYPLCMVYFKNMKSAHQSIVNYLEKIMNSTHFIDNKGRKINLQNTIFLYDTMDYKHHIGFLKSTNHTIQRLASVKSSTNSHEGYLALLDKYHIRIKGIESLTDEQIEQVIYKIILDGEGEYQILNNQEYRKIKEEINTHK